MIGALRVSLTPLFFWHYYNHCRPAGLPSKLTVFTLPCSHNENISQSKTCNMLWNATAHPTTGLQIRIQWGLSQTQISFFFFWLGWRANKRAPKKKKEKILSLINVLAFLYVCINHLLHTHQPGVHFVLLSPSKRAEGPTKTLLAAGSCNFCWGL